MAKIKFKHSGSFRHTERFLQRMRKLDLQALADRYGQEGVEALRNSTPIDTGLTSNSWAYKTEIKYRGVTIEWYNTNVQDGYNIAVLIYRGHGTRDGSYIRGRDFINPAIQPVFERMAEELWSEVRNA